MRDFPEGTQILGSPPPLHPLRDRYTGRIAVLPDGSEEVLDPSLLVPDESPAPEVAWEPSDAEGAEA